MSTIIGTDASTQLRGTNDSDTIIGNGGNDTLVGLAGVDTYVFNFTVQQTEAEDFTTWASHWPGFTSSRVTFDSTGDVADGTAPGQFDLAYKAWLSYLVETYHLGKDLDGDGKVGVRLDIDGSVAPGTGERMPLIEGLSEADMAKLFTDIDDFRNGNKTWQYLGTFGADSTKIAASDGNDIIYDSWGQTAEGTAANKLVFHGMTAAQWDTMVASGDITGSVGAYDPRDAIADFKISWAGGSIVIAGTEKFHFTSLTEVKDLITFDL
ncbi:hypothetical protein [Prosthecomicrobium sp. N25]|uniref:hypothetical protein n=1 Tax=Prosthecomicrobium sp. N25 TaxID=3129254 RepID=UPI0030773CDB